MRVLRMAMAAMLCLPMLLGCYKTTQLHILNEYEVEYLKQCLLHDYTQTELAQCYIELSEEVRFGNKQLEYIEGHSKALKELQ